MSKDNFYTRCPPPDPETWHLEEEDVDVARCTECGSPAWYDTCRSELVCKNVTTGKCGLVLQSPHPYVAGRKVSYPLIDGEKPKPLKFSSHYHENIHRMNAQIVWWKNWLNKSAPRIYPDDKRHFIPKNDKYNK